MKNASNILSNSLLSAHAVKLGDGKADGWVKLIPAGRFSGRDGRGPYDAGDRGQLEQIAAMTRSYAGSTDLVIDYEHQTLKAAQNGKPAPAAGWISQVEVRDDGLYGLPNWTQAAQSAIDADEYRYLSPVYFHTKAGKVLALQCVALTNTPNLDGLCDLSAHSVFPQTINEETMKLEQLIAALGLKTGASEEDVLVAVNSLLTSASAIAVATGLAKDAKPDDVLTAVQSAFADRDAVAKVIGFDLASGGDISVAVQATMKDGKLDVTKFVPIEQVAAMQADLNSLKTDLQADKATEAVEAAIRDGKLVPALKDWAISMHSADPTKFEEFIGKSPVLTSAQRANTTPPGGSTSVLSDEDETVIAAMGLDREAYSKNLAASEEA